MKSYVKIYGPPLLKALEALERVADQMPEIPFHYHYVMGVIRVGKSDVAPTRQEEKLRGIGERYVAKNKTLVSKSGYTLGENDYFFEWAKDPSPQQMRALIGRIDEALAPLGCRYTITTK